jgi:MoaA/NifB/PqqE/SkfB family radical SAM enzyme
MTVAASKGGIFPGLSIRKGYEIPIVALWRDIGEHRLTGEELYRSLAAIAKPRQVELGIGNTCGLQCRHCFLAYDSGSMHDSLVSLGRLELLTAELVEQWNTRIIALTDRDALTPGRSVPLFRHLAQLRSIHPDLIFGGVTNGIALDRYVKDLAEIHLDFLDISLDGPREEHDSIRGVGTFDRTLGNLRLALEKDIADRILVASTLTRFNAASLVRLLQQLITEERLQWFDIGPLMAVKMQPYQLGACDCSSFLSELRGHLEQVNAIEPVTIFFEICAYCAAFIPALIDDGWLKPAELREDAFGRLYQEVEINDAITLVLRPELIPEYWRFSWRITADGYVVGGCEPLAHNDYSRLAVGNVQREEFADIFLKAIGRGSPFHQMMRAYDSSPCSQRQCFRHCLGGDSLLAASVLGSFERKDPNCCWDEYRYSKEESRVLQIV